MANEKPNKGTICCRDRCTKQATLLSMWGEAYCRDCMWATDHAADARRCEVISNRIQGLNDDGSMTANRNLGGEIDRGRNDGN
jgi:hypothetical protein